MVSTEARSSKLGSSSCLLSASVRTPCWQLFPLRYRNRARGTASREHQLQFTKQGSQSGETPGDGQPKTSWSR